MRGYWDHRLMVRAPEGDAGGAGGGSQGSGGQGGGGQNGGQQQQQRPAWADEFGDNFDGDRAYSTITNLRNSERTMRGEIAQLKQQLQEAGSNKTELEKLTSRLESIERENQEFKSRERTGRLRAQVADAARSAGAHNPDDIYALLDPSALDIEEDEKAGVLRVRNATALVNTLKRDKAYLFSTRPADAGAGRGQNNGNGNGSGRQQGEGNLGDAVRTVFGVR